MVAQEDLPGWTHYIDSDYRDDAWINGWGWVVQYDHMISEWVAVPPETVERGGILWYFPSREDAIKATEDYLRGKPLPATPPEVPPLPEGHITQDQKRFEELCAAEAERLRGDSPDVREKSS